MRKMSTKENRQQDLIFKILKKARETGFIVKGILETTKALEIGLLFMDLIHLKKNNKSS